MLSEDFKELQEFCEKKGFQLLNESLEDNTKFFVVSKKKDIWDGFEFAEVSMANINDDCFTTGRVYKIHSINGRILTVSSDNVGDQNGWIKEYFKPSTESAYIEQLKAECLKRFGEIKEGDRFDFTSIDQAWSSKNSLAGSIYEYDKSKDRLLVGSTCLKHAIYQQGKWATFVPERVKVSEELLEAIRKWIDIDLPYDVYENIEGGKYSIDRAKFLASQLEEYLNKPNS